MSQAKKVSVVKTAQTANTLKLILDGSVVGSVVGTTAESVELRNGNDRLLGTYSDAETAIADFERTLGLDEIGIEL